MDKTDRLIKIIRVLNLKIANYYQKGFVKVEVGGIHRYSGLELQLRINASHYETFAKVYKLNESGDGSFE